MNFAEMWDTAAGTEKKQFDTEDLPEGTYTCEVLVCKMGRNKADTKDMISWDLRVVQGEQKNRHIWVHRPFSKETTEENQKAIARALDDFKQLDLKADSKSIKQTMLDIVGKLIEISLKNGTNGQFRNFRRIVEGAVDAPKPAPGAGAFPGVPDDEIPF